MLRTTHNNYKIVIIHLTLYLLAMSLFPKPNTLYFMLFVSSGEMENIEYHPNSKDVRTFTANPGGGTKNTLHVQLFSRILPFLHLIIVSWRTKKSLPSNSLCVCILTPSFMFTAVIAGGVTGVALAAALAALLIYTWQKKDNGGYILGQQRASDEDYHRPDRE
uniref:Syndecan/Neurexin domain-containing protein n=1 Tax=Sander lucioperca TaxID=283035 RepID=A0A8D0CNA1_SANLU